MNKMTSVMDSGGQFYRSFSACSFPAAHRLAAHRSPLTAHRPSAFSLIEVMLSLMVISVGMLAVLALFPMSMDQNARAVANSHAALFADELLNGIRACADENWTGLKPNLVLPVAAASMWGDESDPVLTNRFTGTNVTTNVYMYTNIMNHAIRYRLALLTNGNIKATTLWVWSGQYGVTSAPIVFYAEYFNCRPQ